MAEDTDKTGASAKPEETSAKADAKSELPAVDSPSISPAKAEPEPEAAKEPALTAEALVEPAGDALTAPAPAVKAPFRWRARHKMMATLAASIVLSAAVGGVVGFAASGGFTKPEPPRVDTAMLQERKVMQQSIAKLNKEIGTLKANLEAANKTAHTQIAKLSDRLTREAAEITASISAPQTTAPASAQASTPLPVPRPTRMASAEPARPSVLRDWTIRDSRDGYVYVQGHGDIYQVVPGAPLPGVGPVEQIRRQDGRWVVVTPKGLIVSARDRGYFE